MSSQLASDVVLPLEPQPIISFDELVQTIEAIQAKENADRVALEQFFTINEMELRETLKTWASKGFPNNYVLFEIQLNKLEKCIDGQIRDLFQYIQYLRPSDNISTTLSTLQVRLPGMTLSYSYTDDFKFRVHVSKLQID